jgi:hypothetical protein
VLLGQRSPRVRSVPAYVSSAGPEACDLLRSAGQEPDLWQEDAVTDILGERADGRWAARRTYVTVPRQNGKGGIIEPIELYSLFVLHEVTLHSAHLFDTARDAFMRILALIEGTPDLAKRLKRVNHAHGKEGIELLPPRGHYKGGALYFHARTKGGGRGKSPQRIVLDEAFALTREHMAALLPSISAQEDPQVNAFSTPPPMGEPAEVLMSVRRSVLQAIKDDSRPQVAWLEWGAERGADLYSPTTWAAANPAYGIRLTEETCIDELAGLGLEEFGVERCGIWPMMGDAQWLVIPQADWDEAADPTQDREGRPAFCLEMSPDRSWAAICAAWHRPDGLRQTEVIDHRPGVGWIPGRVADLQKHEPVAWVVARDSPASSEVPALEAAGLQVVRMGHPDAVAGAGLVYDGIAGDLTESDPTGEPVPTPRTLRHAGQDQLDAAAAAAVKRPPDQKAWAWDRARPWSYLLIGVTGAVWGLATQHPEPEQQFFASWR